MVGKDGAKLVGRTVTVWATVDPFSTIPGGEGGGACTGDHNIMTVRCMSGSGGRVWGISIFQ